MIQLARKPSDYLPLPRQRTTSSSSRPTSTTILPPLATVTPQTTATGGFNLSSLTPNGTFSGHPNSSQPSTTAASATTTQPLWMVETKRTTVPGPSVTDAPPLNNGGNGGLSSLSSNSLDRDREKGYGSLRPHELPYPKQVNQ